MIIPGFFHLQLWIFVTDQKQNMPKLNDLTGFYSITVTGLQKMRCLYAFTAAHIILVNCLDDRVYECALLFGGWFLLIIDT